MKLSIAQIQDYMRQAGWPESLIIVWSAVFYFESGGGYTNAHNPRGEDSWGLAQINRRSHNYPVEQLTDPLFNLQVAYQIFLREGPGAWTNTYYGGRYRQYMSAAQAAYNGNPPSYLAPAFDGSGQVEQGRIAGSKGESTTGSAIVYGAGAVA